ncbi:MAG: polysulfide reductase NrfD [Deltaproteobacteria bacterium]|nr:polysulfide reductase NrfD [Deltaproteobacteria bacterium]
MNAAIAELRTKARAARAELEEAPLILGEQTDGSLTKSLLAFNWQKPGKAWLGMFAIALMGTGVLVGAIGYLVSTGIGVWGNNIPVGWAWDITNFVWWIGIGHAGTLISAILLLFQQKWRTSINRSAEAMTIFAVVCALLYPFLHTGRPWLAMFWLLPYPNTMEIWPNFKSPLMWDVFAVSTYGLTSALYWFLGLIPDLASLRDASTDKTRRMIYGFLALGWRGSARAWNHYKIAYLLLAGIATPLVLSVHSVVSFDFAVSVLPGWHTTVFPPYFVAGAVFSGFAMVLTLMIPARHFMKMEHVITMRHIDAMCKVILVTGMIVSYGYLMEHFFAWYSDNGFEFFVFLNRRSGPYRDIFWVMVFCNCVLPHLFWAKQMRNNLAVIFVASLLINVGMWAERFVIIVTSLHRDFIPSSWAMFHPTFVDIGLYIGTISLFSTLFLLFLRFLPAVAMAEVKELRHEMAHEAHLYGTTTPHKEEVAA